MVPTKRKQAQRHFRSTCDWAGTSDSQHVRHQNTSPCKLRLGVFLAENIEAFKYLSVDSFLFFLNEDHELIKI